MRQGRRIFCDGPQRIQLHGTASSGAIVSGPVVVNGTVVTVPVINVPSGGASRDVRFPDVVAGVNPFLTDTDKTLIVNTATFSTPTPGSFGNLGRAAHAGLIAARLDAAQEVLNHRARNLRASV